MSPRILHLWAIYLVHPHLALLTITHGKVQLDHAGMMIVFLKHFNTTRQTLFGIGNIYVRRTDRVRDLIPIITDRMKWSPEKQLKLYEVTTCGFSPILTC